MQDRRREIREAYDEIADDHDERRDRDPPELSLLDDFLAALMSNPHVLDAGCGAGDPIATHLAESATVTGLDFSRAQLALATGRLPDSSLVQGDMTRLPFESDAFDGITSIYAVIHVPRERHRDVFAEFARVLEPGGRLLVTVGKTDWAGSNENWLDFGATMHWDMPGVERTTDLLADAGFTVTDQTEILESVGEEVGYKTFVTAVLE